MLCSHEYVRRVFTAALALALLCAGSASARAQAVDQSFYVTNGSVFAEALSGNTLYIAGFFDQVGPATGGGVPLDASSGAPVSGFPKINGVVLAVVRDGVGGWYIGGYFSTVGGAAHSGIAHILGDNSVSPWDPGVVGGVAAMAMEGNTLYVGGEFTSIGGQPRLNIAALDAVTGAVTAWDPQAGGGNFLGLPVSGLAISGSTVYASGAFTFLGHQSRHHIAAIDAVTGTPTPWDPSADFPVFALAVSGGTVYACGDFGQIGGQPRRGIAALDGTTGLATAWDPRLDNDSAFPECSDLAVSGTLVYAQGDFTHIGGQDRNYLAALDATTGLATPWDPSPDAPSGGDRPTGALAVNGSIVYVGGNFSHIGGQARSRLAALDATTGLATAWNPSANNAPVAIAVSGNIIFAGGYFTSVGGQTRNGFAALDTRTGGVKAWNPDAEFANLYGTFSLAVSGRTVYAAGPFDRVGGQPRSYFAALDGETGLATAWNPNADPPRFNSDYALTVSGKTVYAVGDFTNIGGQPRSGIAALDGTTGQATAWNPNPTVDTDGFFPYPVSISVNGSTAYVGGFFTSIGGQPRNGLAALDVKTGLATAWNPNPDTGSPFSLPDVSAIEVSGKTVYVGGNFRSIGGRDRNCIAALDATTGLATPWDPNPTGIGGFYLNFHRILATGQTVYVAGAFTGIGGQPRNGLAALDAKTGPALAWNPGLTGDTTRLVEALEVKGRTIYVGGWISLTGGRVGSGVAAIEAADAGPDRSEATAAPADNVARDYRLAPVQVTGVTDTKAIPLSLP